jgi:hypothetical protein
MVVAISNSHNWMLQVDENYKKLLAGGEIIYPGVISNQNYRAGNLRTMLVWNPSPDPKIVKV